MPDKCEECQAHIYNDYAPEYCNVHDRNIHEIKECDVGFTENIKNVVFKEKISKQELRCYCDIVYDNHSNSPNYLFHMPSCTMAYDAKKAENQAVKKGCPNGFTEFQKEKCETKQCGHFFKRLLKWEEWK